MKRLTFREQVVADRKERDARLLKQLEEGEGASVQTEDAEETVEEGRSDDQIEYEYGETHSETCSRYLAYNDGQRDLPDCDCEYVNQK